MQYVGRAIGSVSKTWNSINPATLSGAIDVIVVEQEDGDLSCSPFHVRFGKFSLLRPSQKKVDFSVNNSKVDLPMKLGEGGEAYFVFETQGDVPNALLTSPVISPSSSPSGSPRTPESPMTGGLQEPDFLDLANSPMGLDSSPPMSPSAASVASVPTDKGDSAWSSDIRIRSASPPPSREQAIERVKHLTRKFTDINIPNKVTDNGDILLDMTGYKYSDDDIKHSEQLVRKILAEELGVDADLESMIGLDSQGNLRISSKDDDSLPPSSPDSLSGLNIRNSISQHQYASDPNLPLPNGQISGQISTESKPPTDDSTKHFVKTLRLTSDQLRSLNLNPGCNEISFSVNQGKAVCTARMFYWKTNDPIVISDIDGTITKSDALGHVLTMLGRDWTHVGVAKMFTDINSNGYNVMYLTARSVGQADLTRAFLKSVDQSGFKLPDGPVILSPDRTIAALRREVIMKKPEVFKMACLRDIKNLYGKREETPFYAGFGNRITDALSYRTVGVPSSKIFTINSYSIVHLELLELAGYKSNYFDISELVDHYFPPITVATGASQQIYTDFNYWREPVIDLSDLEEDEDRESKSVYDDANESMGTLSHVGTRDTSYLDEEEGDEEEGDEEEVDEEEVDEEEVDEDDLDEADLGDEAEDDEFVDGQEVVDEVNEVDEEEADEEEVDEEEVDADLIGTPSHPEPVRKEAPVNPESGGHPVEFITASKALEALKSLEL